MWRSTMRRIVILTLALLMAPLVTDAQRVGKGVRIGVLSARNPRSASNWTAFEQRLRERGYGEGHQLELAFCSAELARQQTHDRSHAVQAVALFHAWSVVRGAVHVIGDFLAPPILDKLDPRQVQTMLASEGDILRKDGIVKTLTQGEETLSIRMAVRGCVRGGTGGFTALTTLRRAELKAATGIGPYGIQKLAIDDLDAGDGGFRRLDILL